MMEWTCRFCGTRTAAERASCRSCGAARDAAAVALPPAGEAAAAVEAAPSPPAGPKASGKRRVALLAAIAVIAAALGAATSYFGNRRGGETVTVAGFEWERTVEVEDKDTVREEAWADEVPEEAHLVARRRQVHHTEREQVGTRKGQPVYRERPVYADRVAYDIDRWRVVRTAKATGRDQSPRWPDIRLNLGEREGKRGETYVVVLQGQRTYRMRVPREQWQGMHEGQIGTAVVDAAGAVRELR